MPEEKTKYYEATYMVRVLSDRPLGEASGQSGLAGILRECGAGDCVGQLVFGREEEVTPIHMAELLRAAGSEPGFFQLPDMAELVGDLMDSSSDEGCSGDLVVVSTEPFNRLLESVGLGDRTYGTEEDEPPVCILTGEEGEDADDCTTHGHEDQPEVDVNANIRAAAALVPGASCEHPGHISITVGNVDYAFGNANGPIGYDFGPADDPGATRDSTEETIPEDSPPEEIAAFITRIVAAARPRIPGAAATNPAMSTDTAKLIHHNAGNINLPDDPSFPWKLYLNLAPPEFMRVAFCAMYGGSETMVVRSMTREGLIAFTEEHGLNETHPRYRRMEITGPGVTEDHVRDKEPVVSRTAPDEAQDDREAPVSLMDAIREVEKRDFRTVHDTGAHENAMLVMNRLRRMAGLPSISVQDLPTWDGKASYVMPAGSKLLTNLTLPPDEAQDDPPGTPVATHTTEPPCAVVVEEYVEGRHPYADDCDLVVVAPGSMKELAYVVAEELQRAATGETHVLEYERSARVYFMVTHA